MDLNLSLTNDLCFFNDMSFFIDMFYFLKICVGPRGLMDKASDFGSEDCEFESRRGRYFIENCFEYHTIHSKRGKMQQT